MHASDTSSPSDHFLPAPDHDDRDDHDDQTPTPETFVVGEDGGPEQPAPARDGVSRKKRRTPEGRLARALVHGSGHVAVIGRNVDDAGNLLDSVIETVSAHSVVHVAADADAASVARALLDGTDESDWLEEDSAVATRTALGGLLKTARRARSPIVVVADGADGATAEQLDRLRLALEFAPGALDTVKLVLLGTPSLERTLSKSSARGLASRISARVQAPATSHTQTAPARRPSHTSWPARVATLSTIATGALLALLPILAQRPPTQPLRPASITPAAVVRVDTPKTAPGTLPDLPRDAAGSAVTTHTDARAAVTRRRPSLAAATYSLQVGSFRNEANARRLERKLGARFPGVETTRVERNGKALHRVRIAGLTTPEAADDIAAALAALGFDALRVRSSGSSELQGS